MIDATPLLRLYAARRLRRLQADATETQRAQLLRLVRKAEHTLFGTKHGFSRIRSVREFQERVPLRRYEDFWQEYWRPVFPRIQNRTWPGTIPYFARTSGTTSGTTKYIPVSREMIASNRKAVLDIFVHHLANRPHSRVLGGKNFMLGGSTDLVAEAPGVYSGDLSGIGANEVPWWARPRYFPPRQHALISDWEIKIDRLARLSLGQDIRTISDTPSWLLIFFDKLAALRPELPRRLVSYYPNLDLLIHGGVNFAPYRRRFDALLEGSHAELREVYPASEGFVAVADRGSGDGLRLMLDTGLFFEFVPVEELDRKSPVRHWIADAEPGVHYALVLSTCAGLWSYILGDTVEVLERRPPRILVTGRTSYVLSAFGEHLIDKEIEEAVAAAAASVGLTVNDYAVGPVYPDERDSRGGHLCIIEFAETVPASAQLAAFAEALDQALSATNADYQIHRAQSFGMRPPELQAVQPGTFAAWMKARGQIGGQHKVPRVINDPRLLDDLMTFAARPSQSFSR